MIPGSAGESFSPVSKVLQSPRCDPETAPQDQLWRERSAGLYGICRAGCSGVKDSDDCLPLDGERKTKLARYVGQFEFEP